MNDKRKVVICVLVLLFVSMSSVFLYQRGYSDGFEDGYVEGFNNGYLHGKNFVSVEVIETATFLNVPMEEVVITEHSLKCFSWRESGDTHQTLSLKMERGDRLDIRFKYFINKTWHDIMPDTEFREVCVSISTVYVGITFHSVLSFEGLGEIMVSIKCTDWSD